ncbi:hypothetical protein CHS0354_022026 [Potamilus streckersoni]|uniref:Secreted protein n=1 Tax=Potamilus streckersoni TaxID=2493646 RepID=A0AAE0T2G5_9BIVA|nr:hypothetical protein CHS0354_022026 [Potamilus streckersoni]
MSAYLRFTVLRMALVASQNSLLVQDDPRCTSSIPQPFLLGDTVLASLGAHYRGIPHHHQLMVLQLPLSHNMELHVAQHCRQRGSPHRIRLPILHEQLVSLRLGGWGPQTRYAPSQTNDQLPAILQPLGQAF